MPCQAFSRARPRVPGSFPLRSRAQLSRPIEYSRFGQPCQELFIHRKKFYPLDTARFTCQNRRQFRKPRGFLNDFLECWDYCGRISFRVWIGFVTPCARFLFRFERSKSPRLASRAWIYHENRLHFISPIRASPRRRAWQRPNENR